MSEKFTLSENVTALDLPAQELSDSTRRYFEICQEKLGMVPNVLASYAFDDAKLGAFTAMYNDLMLGDSGLSKLEREMIAVVVSSINKCYYCLTAHGAAVRQLSGDHGAVETGGDGRRHFSEGRGGTQHAGSESVNPRGADIPLGVDQRGELLDQRPVLVKGDHRDLDDLVGTAESGGLDVDHDNGVGRSE